MKDWEIKRAEMMTREAKDGLAAMEYGLRRMAEEGPEWAYEWSYQALRRKWRIPGGQPPQWDVQGEERRGYEVVRYRALARLLSRPEDRLIASQEADHQALILQALTCGISESRAFALVPRGGVDGGFASLPMGLWPIG